MSAARLFVGGSVLVSAVVACGGGSSGSGSSNGFVTPALNSRKAYVVTDVDPTSTSVNTAIDTVATVGQDGPFSYSESVPPGTAVIGPHFMQALYSDDATGHLVHVFYSLSLLDCAASPHGQGPVFPLTVGATWQLAYAVQCAPTEPPVSVPTTYTQIGSVVALESIAVPAGQFAAFRVQSTISWPACPGNCTETLTEWLDANNGQLLKSIAVYNYGTAGTITTTTLMSETRELQSQQ